jgi:hypothetical protein
MLKILNPFGRDHGGVRLDIASRTRCGFEELQPRVATLRETLAHTNESFTNTISQVQNRFIGMAWPGLDFVFAT